MLTCQPHGMLPYLCLLSQLIIYSTLFHPRKCPGAGNKLFHRPNYKLLSGPLLSWCFHISFDLRCFSESCRLRRGRGGRPDPLHVAGGQGWRKLGMAACWVHTGGMKSRLPQAGQAPPSVPGNMPRIYKKQCSPRELSFLLRK